MYYCSECKSVAIVYDSRIFIACNCNKPIVAQMTAAMSGAGGVSV